MYDGPNIILELGQTNNIKSKYIRGINLIAAYNASNVKSFYLFNGHGDVVQLTNTSGNVVKTYDYDAFGNEKQPLEGDVNPFRYCAEYYDKETGTYYLRAMYYDPAIGRFINADSYLGRHDDPLSLNLYTYCHNNPVLCFLRGNNKNMVNSNKSV